MFCSCKSQFRELNLIVPFEKFLFLVLASNTIMLPHLITHSSLHYMYLSTGHLREVKNKGKFWTFSYELKWSWLVANERCSLTRGSKYSDLTWKHLEFGKLVAEERWSLMRGGCNQRFNCIYFCVVLWTNLIKKPKVFTAEFSKRKRKYALCVSIKL